VDTLELLLHPVRVRIVHAFFGGQTRTTSELCARLPDVSKATVYRHVAVLADEGLLEVAGEERVHGAVERHYRLRTERAVIDSEMAESMSIEDHRHGFAAALAALMAEFNSYLDRDDANPTVDRVGYRQIPVWLNREEIDELLVSVRKLVMSLMDNQRDPGRRPYLLSPIIFPIGP
jgi:DNA-binding transcriptional ArsR family regulator